jgi:hypothetical protein
MTSAPKRRWFRFSLRTLFVVVTVFGIWLGWQLHFVTRRKQAINWLEEAGGLAIHSSWVRDDPSLARDRPDVLNWPQLPFWRRWLGDETIVEIWIPKDAYNEANIARLAKCFPEAVLRDPKTLEPPQEGDGSPVNRLIETSPATH